MLPLFIRVEWEEEPYFFPTKGRDMKQKPSSYTVYTSIEIRLSLLPTFGYHEDEPLNCYHLGVAKNSLHRFCWMAKRSTCHENRSKMTENEKASFVHMCIPSTLKSINFKLFVNPKLKEQRNKSRKGQSQLFFIFYFCNMDPQCKQ